MNEVKCYSAVGRLGRLLAVRLLPGQDVVEVVIELGVGHGVFETDEDGEVVLHVHGLIVDKDGNMRCGNLVPGSAPVLATVDMTIQEMEGLELVPTLDEAYKHKFLHPIREEGDI